MNYNYLVYLTYVVFLKEKNNQLFLNIDELYIKVSQTHIKLLLIQNFLNCVNSSTTILKTKSRYKTWLSLKAKKGLFTQKNRNNFKFTNVCNKRINKQFSKLLLQIKHHVDFLYKTNQFDSYLEYSLLQIEMSEKTKEQADTYKKRGSIYADLYQYNFALDEYKKSLILYQLMFGNRSIITIDMYSDVGLIYDALEDFTKALKFHYITLKYLKKYYKFQHVYIANAYDNLGWTYNCLGKYNLALKCHKKAIHLNKSFSNKQTNTLSRSYNNMGLVYDIIGEYNLASKYYIKAINIQTNVFRNSDLPLLSTLYNNLAVVYSKLGVYEKSLSYQNESLKIMKMFLNEESLEIATVHNNIGLLFSQTGDYKQALEHCYKSLYIRKKIYDKYHSDLASSYNNLGLIYFHCHDYENAIIYANETLKITKYLLGNSHIYTVLALYNIGILHKKMENYKESYKCLFHAISNNSKLIRETTLNFTTNDTKSFLKNQNQNNIIKELLSILRFYLKGLSKEKSIQSIEAVYNQFLIAKGCIQDNEALISIILSVTDDSFLKEQIYLLKNKKYRLAKFLQDYTSQDKIEKIRQEISDIEIYLAKHIERFKQEQELNNLDYKEISQYLLNGQVFIDFTFGEDNLYIFVIHSDKTINFIEVSKSDTSFIKKNIKNFITNVNETISQLETKTITKKIFEVEKENVNEILKKLFTTLINKYLNRYINKYQKLIISQDGLLNKLPLEALYDGKEYLLYKKDITYIASGRELIRLHRFGTSTNKQLSINIFANPTYDYTSKKDISSFRTTRALKAFSLCKALPNTRGEALSIQDTTKQAILFIEKDANEENLKSTTNAKILHIATHGMVVENEDEKEPLLKCALALTGYNTSIKEKKDYGVFTGLKIASLDLKNTDLVVLSACESAKGQSDTTEGIASLSRAFMMAGANATIASLWEVNDEYSKDFFTQYYKKLSISSDYNKAFKETQLESFNNLQNKGLDHPLFWACFCFFGTGE